MKKLFTMKRIVKSLLVLFAVAVVIFLAGVVLPFLIGLFFKALLFGMQEPLIMIGLVVSFMLGMLCTDLADRADKLLNK